MTNSADEEYEVLPSAKSLNLPLGIRCMEVNVQEVDEAVRQFTKKSTDIASPSWKFPHVTLEKLDVTHVMNVFRAHKALSDNQLYMELMELLIDRLYYAIITSYEFVNGLEAAFLNAGFQIDNHFSSKRGGKQRTWDPLEIAKKSVEDKTPKPFHTANIGMLVRQFCFKMLGLENIVLNNVHSLKKSENEGGKVKKDLPTLPRHSGTQTEISSDDGCECCFISQNILKIVADKVDATFKTFSQSDSQIAKTRLELRKDALSITQRGALLRWLNALQTDCENITECANMLLDINVKYQDDVRTLKEDIEIKEEQHEKQMRTVQQTLTGVREDLKTEQDCRSKISKLKDATIIKYNEMEKCLKGKMKECEKLDQEREALQRSFNIAEELNLQIKNNLARSTHDMEKLKKDLDTERKQKDSLTQQVRNLSEQLAKAGQDVMRMSESTEQLKHMEEENTEMQREVKRLKKALEKHETRDSESTRVVEEKETKISRLEEELRKAHSKIEVLTLYPDLNGPINTPMKSTGASCVETMEMQVKSNQIRMEILRAQSDRLSKTVIKLRNHMKSQTDLQSRTSETSSTASAD